MIAMVLTAVAAGPVRAVATDGMALACEGLTTARCPKEVLTVSVSPPTGPVVVEEVPARLVSGGDPCDWVLVPEPVPGAATTKRELRAATALPLISSVYARHVSKATGLPVKRFTALLRVDLDGDGRDEVVFSAESHPTPADGPFPMGVKGWSIVGVRRIEGETVKTHVLLKHQTAAASELDPNPMYRRATLRGLTDLEGDGNLEIVVGDAYYEGWGYTVFGLGTEPKDLGSSGCGV